MPRYLKFTKIFLIIFIILNSEFLILNSAHAVNEFITSYSITYEVRSDGITKVTQNVSLTNLTSDLRAKSYTLTLRTPNITNISAFDSGGPLKIKVDKNTEQTTIQAEFNDIIAGKNKVLNWTLYYETNELANKNGQIWEVTLPGTPEGENLGQYTITLKIPKEFGPVLYFSPPSRNGLTWTKEEIGTGGISAAFGEKQLFNFQFKYHLANKKPYPVTTEIALPIDTAYQKVYVKKIEPLPNDVIIDEDGNWLAQYNLNKGQSLEVTALGQAQLFFTPQNQTLLSYESRQKYLNPQKNWEANDPEIKKIASQLKTADKIYHFVVATLEYDFKKVEQRSVQRLGAKRALQKKNEAICMEFTDLFIALARAANIPARELNGYAYTTNPKLRPLSLEKDILHSWPEYYNDEKKTWVPVDPTWGNTTKGVDYFNKLDLNHFVFVIKGKNSEYPPPAGSYKTNGDGKDVEITLATQEEKPNYFQPTIDIETPKKIIAGFSGEANIHITNETGSLVKIEKVKIETDRIFLDSSEKIVLDVLPPYANKIMPIKLKASPIWTNTTAQITLIVNDQKITKEILIRPIIYDRIGQIIGGIFGLAILFTITFFSWRLYLQRKKRATSLRGEREQPQIKS